MNEKELRKLISEGLSGGIKKEEFELDSNDIVDFDQEEINLDLDSDDISDVDPIDMADVDMPIKDKAVFSAMDGEEDFGDFDDFDELLAKYKTQGGDYEGGYEDDAPVSPGYFNEGDDIDPIAAAKTKGKSNHDFYADAIEYAGKENWDKMSDSERSEVINDLERDFDRNFSNEGKVVQITKDQLQKIIKEGVKQLHKKSLIENRLEQINQELNALNNPEAWEGAHKEAQNQLRKKTIAFNNMIPRERLVNEGVDVSSKIDLKSKLNDALYGWDSENSDFGYLHREKILQGKVSPRQMVDRISKVIDDLNAYIEDLEYRKSSIQADIKNPDYEKTWGSLERGSMDI